MWIQTGSRGASASSPALGTTIRTWEVTRSIPVGIKAWRPVRRLERSQPFIATLICSMLLQHHLNFSFVFGSHVLHFYNILLCNVVCSDCSVCQITKQQYMGCSSNGYWYIVCKGFIYCSLFVLFRIVWSSPLIRSFFHLLLSKGSHHTSHIFTY